MAIEKKIASGKWWMSSHWKSAFFSAETIRTLPAEWQDFWDDPQVYEPWETIGSSIGSVEFQP